METTWETELAGLLGELLGVQESLLSVLARKHDLLAAGDTEGLVALGPEEEQLVARLQGCVSHREQLLAQAAAEGLPADSLRALAGSLPRAERRQLEEPIARAASQARLLRHRCLVHWVVVQRTLLHLSQMLEIIATGGRPQPTYSKSETQNTNGVLVDRAA